MNPRFGEVWLATVPFENEYNAKKRPVVVLEDKTSYVEVLAMTSRPPELAGEFFYQIGNA
jgi:hypothetical protein